MTFHAAQMPCMCLLRLHAVRAIVGAKPVVIRVVHAAQQLVTALTLTVDGTKRLRVLTAPIRVPFFLHLRTQCQYITGCVVKDFPCCVSKKGGKR